MIAHILSALFPPCLPGYIRDWRERIEYDFPVASSASHATPKTYLDGIDRYFAELAAEYLPGPTRQSSQLPCAPGQTDHFFVPRGKERHE